MFRWRNEKPMFHEEHTVVDSAASEPQVDSSATTARESFPPESSLPGCAPQESTTVTPLPAFPARTESPPQSWKEALYRTCLTKQCLTRTPRQVLQEHASVLRPCADCVILSQNDPAVTAKSIVQQMQKSSKQETSWGRRVVSGVSWTVSKVLEKVLQDADDYEQDEVTWNEQDDHATQESVELVGWDQPVVCVDLVEETVNQFSSRTQHELLALHRHGAGDYSLAKWTAFPYNMTDSDLIAHVLVEAGHAVFHQDYIVFGKNTTESQREVAVALVQLKQALVDTECHLEAWTMRADEYTVQAFQKKRTRDCKGALHELQKRKLVQSKMEHARASILNLQQAHDALETAQMQHSQVLKPLQATASALKGLRQDHCVEDVDDLYDDLKEEYEHLNDLSSAVSENSDEDELLEELKRLTVKDEAEKETLSNTQESTAIGTEADASSHDTFTEKQKKPPAVESKQVTEEKAMNDKGVATHKLCNNHV